jgi:nitroreductase
MHFDELLARRSSIRAFRPDPVDPHVLHGILAAALESPSWANTQPYRVALAAGDRCDALRRDMLAAAASDVPSPDHDMLFDYPPPLRGRRRDAGVGLYGVLDIARDDHAAREAQYRRNFAFFDAPAVAFLFAHGGLGTYSVLDAGVFLQSLLLAATHAGIGACAQASLASYPQVVRRHFDVPPEYRLLCGVSLGHPADEPVNRFRPPRASVDELLVAAKPY